MFRQSSKIILFWTVMATAFLSVGLLLLSRKFSQTETANIDNIYQLICALIATICCVITSFRSKKRTKAGWLFMALGCLLWTLGQAIFSYYEVLLQVDAPFPSLADASFELATLAFCLSIATWFSAQSSHRARIITDGVIIATATLEIIWRAFDRTFEMSHQPLTTTVVVIMYPLGEVMLVVMTVLLAINASARQRSAIVWIGAALSILTVTDFTYDYLQQLGHYRTGLLIDLGWPLCFLLIMVAAQRQTTLHNQPPQMIQSSNWRSVLPTIPMIVAISLALMHTKTDPFTWSEQLAIGVLLTATGVRQLISASESSNTQKVLREKEQKALEASRLKSQFVATVSHEIRNPMHGVLGMAEMLLMEDLTPHQLHLVSGIHESAAGLRTILDDILDLSKIEAGKLVIEPINFDLTTLINSAAAGFAVQAEFKGIDLQVKVDTDVPSVVHGDDMRVRQVLVNLLSNAVKFTETGGVTLHVMPGNQENTILFEIKDTGVGISPEKIDQLFEPFVQADSTTTRKFGGTGLGLVICKQLVQLMDGTMHASSVVGKGSTFYFQLPLVKADIALQLPTSLINDDENLPDGLHILLAEDNIINQTIVTHIAQRLRVNVTVASNGEEAVERFKQESFDLILMDCEMPIMDGFTATQHIRDIERKSPTKNYTPIIALTANATDNYRQLTLSVGMDMHLSKPFTQYQLSQAIKSLTSGQLPLVKKSESESPERPELFDVECLNNLGEFSLIIKLLDMFEQQTRNRLDEIRNAVASQNINEIRQTAHRLRSPAASLSMTKLAEVSSQLEQLETIDTEVCTSIISQIETLAIETPLAMRNFLEDLQRLSSSSEPVKTSAADD